MTSLVAEVGRMTRVSSGPSLVGGGKCGSGGEVWGWVSCRDVLT